MMTSFSGDRLLVTLWVGSLLSIGFIAVPLAFITFDNVEIAGNYAGELFRVVNLLGIGCAIALLLTKLIQHGKNTFKLWRVWIISVMLILTLYLIVFLFPEADAIKRLDWRTDPILSEQFSSLHSLSEVVYSIISLLGITLVVSTDSIHSSLK
jgi:Mn2+/Fe2+ NRAMP family transporter